MTNPVDREEIAKPRWSRKDWILLGTNALIFVVLYLIFDRRLPDEVASHYNIRGEADDTMSRGGFWLFYAGMGVALPTVLSLARYVDPRKSNYARFEGYYDLMRWAISLFLHSVLLLVLLDNVGHKLPVPNFIMGGLGILWMVIGNRMGQVRSNFFIGFRTPWALSDERNWKLTHRLGARLWFAAGAIMFASAWFTPAGWTIAVLLVCALSSSLVPAAYSYLLSRRGSNA